MVGLLFLALIFFAFGKADAARNGNQSAADAAALAAAQESRDQLASLFHANILDIGWLGDILSGNRIGTFNGCLEAQRFAQLNGAGRVRCSQLSDGRWGFSVKVTSNRSMGKSILPGTENKHAKSYATAVVEPRCWFQPNQEPGPKPTTTLPATVGGSTGGGSGGGGGHHLPSPGTIACNDRNWLIDPDHLDHLPDMADLFTVRLAED